MVDTDEQVAVVGDELFTGPLGRCPIDGRVLDAVGTQAWSCGDHSFLRFTVIEAVAVPA